MATIVAETPRLILRDWSDGDVEPRARIGTADVVRYLGGTPWTTTAARESIDRWRQIDARLGTTTWAVCPRDSDEIIGTCGSQVRTCRGVQGAFTAPTILCRLS